MVVSEEMMSKLRKTFGLNLYEVRVWTGLLSKGRSTAGELSEISNVPRSRTYDILESLEKKGFIMMKMGKPIQYMALSPKEVIGRMRLNTAKEIKLKEKRLDELETSKDLTELQMLFRNGIENIDPLELSGVIKGRDNIYSRLEAMINNSKKSVSLVIPSSEIREKTDVLKKSIENARKRGVSVEIITTEEKDNKEFMSSVAKMANVSNKDIGARFAISDNNQILFMLLPHEQVHPKYDVGVWVQSEMFVNAISNMMK